MESLGHVVPINNAPNGFQVVRTDIFVLQIIGMFPNIDSQQWNQTMSGLERILIAGSSKLDLTIDRIVSLQKS